jgi:hypothetical protein
MSSTTRNLSWVRFPVKVVSVVVITADNAIRTNVLGFRDCIDTDIQLYAYDKLWVKGEW